MKHDQCQKRKNTIDTNKRNGSAQGSGGLAVVPCVEGLSETAGGVLREYGINAAVGPCGTLGQLLVHRGGRGRRAVGQAGECVRGSMPRLRLCMCWRDWQKLWEEIRGTQKRSRID